MPEAAPSVAEAPLDDWELASRMSFFLWSSIPDDELRRAAAAGELRDPARLAAQVKRMTADPKARRLATEFFGQWLGFYHFDQYRGIDTGRFPEFTEEVKALMYDEAVSTFEYIVRHNRPVKEILDADYFVCGHQPQEQGYDVLHERMIILASEHNHGVFLTLDLAKPVTLEYLLKNIRPFAAIA